MNTSEDPYSTASCRKRPFWKAPPRVPNVNTLLWGNFRTRTKNGSGSITKSSSSSSLNSTSPAMSQMPHLPMVHSFGSLVIVSSPAKEMPKSTAISPDFVLDGSDEGGWLRIPSNSDEDFLSRMGTPRQPPLTDLCAIEFTRLSTPMSPRTPTEPLEKSIEKAKTESKDVVAAVRFIQQNLHYDNFFEFFVYGPFSVVEALRFGIERLSEVLTAEEVQESDCPSTPPNSPCEFDCHPGPLGTPAAWCGESKPSLLVWNKCECTESEA